jgi:DNA-binding transcriptional ArsR family regulator
MPNYADPKLAKTVKVAISHFSNPAKVAIIGFLQEHGSATRGEIAKGLGMAPPTVLNNLQLLTSTGALLADPPQNEERTGQRVRYSLNRPEIARSYEILGRAIGLHGTDDGSGRSEE